MNETRVALLSVWLASAMVTAIILSSCETVAEAGESPPPLPANVRVIDGDTFAIGKKSWRVLGYNTPEIYRPKCNEELALGIRAKNLFENLLKHPSARIDYSDRTDVYGRGLARVFVLNHDMADILVPMGLAHKSKGVWCNG